MLRVHVATLVTVVVAVACAANARAQTLENTLVGLGTTPLRIGDVDLDGKADVMVAVPAGTEPNVGGGEVRMFSSASWTLLYTVHGPASAAYSFATNQSTAAIGDVDLDGRPDFAVGAMKEPIAPSVLGSVRVCSGANGTQLFFVANPSSGDDFFGSVVSAAGDIDNDGHPDFAVSAPVDWNDPPTNVYVYSGANAQVLRVYSSQSATYTHFGQRIDDVGDLDLDGFTDLIVSEPAEYDVGAPPDSVYAFSGATGQQLLHISTGSAIGWNGNLTVAGLGDVDANGVPDFGARRQTVAGGSLVVFSGATGSMEYEVAPFTPNDVVGIAMDGLGDVDGDGADDFMVSSQLVYSTSPQSMGAVVGCSGATGGLLFRLFHPAKTIFPLTAGAVDLGDVDGDLRDDIAIPFQQAPFHWSSTATVEVWSPFGDLVLPYGLGCPGSGGFSPVLGGSFAGSTVNLTLTNGLGGSFAALLLGTAAKQTPIVGNTCLLQVTQNSPIVPLVPLGGTGPGAGSFALGATWPTSLPFVFVQAIVADPGVIRGYSASNGLELGRH